MNRRRDEVEEPEPDELPEGAVAAPEDGSVPEGYEIKGNANSMKYHVPGGRYYDITIGDVFFDTAEHAEAAGTRPLPTRLSSKSRRASRR